MFLTDFCIILNTTVFIFEKSNLTTVAPFKWQIQSNSAKKKKIDDSRGKGDVKVLEPLLCTINHNIMTVMLYVGWH